MKESCNLEKIVDFFFENGILQNTQRSGIPFLGSGNQTIAAHIFRTAIIGYTLAKISNADVTKVLLMCLFHDIEESRTGDLNYLQQKYVKSDDDKALDDVLKELPFANEIKSIIEEYAIAESLEAKVAKDADSLELALFLKENLDKGNPQAKNWLIHVEKRLYTNLAKDIYKKILEKNYYDWWYYLQHDWSTTSKKW